MFKLYRSYNDLKNIFYAWEHTYPKLIRITSIGKSHEGRHIYCLKLGQESEKKKPALLYTGTVHAREWIGCELGIETIQCILDRKDHDPIIDEFLTKGSIYFIPLVNPDGFEYSRTHFAFWRKNRRPLGNGEYGVDLNRNFDSNFKSNEDIYSNEYPGPHAFSEPETYALKTFIENHPNITIALDYHSQGNVFFPAQCPSDEDLPGTSTAIALCANMAAIVKSISGRFYGIQLGKPPGPVVHGSGREYYHSKGLFSTVVEVGTRNIPDYLDDLKEHIREHIPAIIYAWGESLLYGGNTCLLPVRRFNGHLLKGNEVLLMWEFPASDDVDFEIHRSTQEKDALNQSTFLGKTRDLQYVDHPPELNKIYYYHIRTIQGEKKSPFSPTVSIRTLNHPYEVSTQLFPVASQIGSILRPTSGKEMFKKNCLYSGNHKDKGQYSGLIVFSIKDIPKMVDFKKVSLNLFPFDRTEVTIERFSEWTLDLFTLQNLKEIEKKENLLKRNPDIKLGIQIRSHELRQGIWRKWELTSFECRQLSELPSCKYLCFRINGPTEVKLGRISQLMKWESGNDKGGWGEQFQPNLEISYHPISKRASISPTKINSLASPLDHSNINHFGRKGGKIICQMEYDFPRETKGLKIIRANFQMLIDDLKSGGDDRIHLELLAKPIRSINGFDNRKTVETLGYDLSSNDIALGQLNYFVFDTFPLMKINERLKKKKKLYLILFTTSPIEKSSDHWFALPKEKSKLPKLNLELAKEEPENNSKIKNLNFFIKDGRLMLKWNNLKNKKTKVRVIKNPFVPPLNPFNGDLVYEGNEENAMDQYGDLKRSKYFSIFVEDERRNWGPAVTGHYLGR